MAAPYVEQKDHLDFAKLGDTGQDNTDAIAPISNGDPADQTTFRRPSENLRERTEDLRQFAEDAFYYRDVQHLAITSTGSLTWGGTVLSGGTGLITQAAAIRVKPFLTPRADTKAVITVGTVAVNEITYTVTALGWSTNRMNQVFIEHLDGGATTPLTVSISDGPVKRIRVLFDGTNVLHDAPSVQSAVNAAIAGDTDLVGKLNATITGIAGNTITALTETRFEGTHEAEEHVIAAGVLDALTTSTPLQAGDTVAIWYRYVVDPLGGFDGRKESTGTHGTTNVPLASLFVTSSDASKIPGAIPLCTVEGNSALPGGKLVFVDGTTLNKDDVLYLGGSAASLSYYGGGNAWADGSLNPPTTVEGQLDKVINDLGQGIGGTAKISGATLAASAPGNDSVVAGSANAQMQDLLDLINKRADLTETTLQTFADALSVTTATPGVPALSATAAVAATNTNGITAIGRGDGHGIEATGGVTASGDYAGVRGRGAGTVGTGVYGSGTPTGNGVGVAGTGTGSGPGVVAGGGDTDAYGAYASGGRTFYGGGTNNGDFTTGSSNFTSPSAAFVNAAHPAGDIGRVIKATNGNNSGYSFVITAVLSATSVTISPAPITSTLDSWTLYSPGGAGVYAVGGNSQGSAAGVRGFGAGQGTGVEGTGGSSGGAGVVGNGGVPGVPSVAAAGIGVLGTGGAGVSYGGHGVKGDGGSGALGGGSGGYFTGSVVAPGVVGIGGNTGGSGGLFAAGTQLNSVGSLSIAATAGNGYGAGGIGGSGFLLFTGATGQVNNFQFTHADAYVFTVGNVGDVIKLTTGLLSGYHYLITGYISATQVNITFLIANGPNFSTSGLGWELHKNSGAGVSGSTSVLMGAGVSGISNVAGPGVDGFAGTEPLGVGVYGHAGTHATAPGPGIYGRAATAGDNTVGRGFGASFEGSTVFSPLQLIPQASTPTATITGSMYVDAAGELWYRKSGSWVQLS